MMNLHLCRCDLVSAVECAQMCWSRLFAQGMELGVPEIPLSIYISIYTHREILICLGSHTASRTWVDTGGLSSSISGTKWFSG